MALVPLRSSRVPACGPVGSRRRRVPALASVLVLSVGLAGCGGSTPDAPSGTSAASGSASAASASGSASATASPTSTLSAEQQEAFEQATNVVMAYRQTITDLYSGARTRINDLDNYVTGDLLEQERINVQQGLGQGIRSEPQGAQLVLQAADPERVALEGDEPTVVLTACIDGTAVTDILPDGGSRPGVRERLYYRVVRTAYLPGPGWAVAEVTAEADAKDRAC